MRLTLRTLLAYLDGILDPHDSQDLAKKVEESEYATSLVHRIRDVTRRLRLGAPNATDRSPGLDPNTVAEYLDNTLPTERVADFEKVCLDSDVHLAETAACHQILTIVLGEPADVDPATREQIYQLKDVRGGVKPPRPPLPPSCVVPKGATPPTLDLDTGDSGIRRSRPKPTVPEYLREPRKRPAWLPIAAGLVLAVAVLVVGLYALGQLEPGTPVGNLLVEYGIVAAPREVGREGRGERGEGRGKTGTPSGEPVKDVKEEHATTEPATKPIAPLPLQPPTKEPTTKEPVAKEPAVSAPPTTATEPKTEPSPVAPPLETPASPADGTAKSEPKSTVPPSGEEKKEPPKPAVPPPAPPEPLGTLVSTDQVLLIDHPEGDWTRVETNQMLIPAQVLVPPTYRAKLKLTAGVALDIIGPARIELTGSGVPGRPRTLQGIHVLYGRVVLVPLDKNAGSHIRVAFGDRVGTISLADPDSTAAFDVRRVVASGTNPEGAPARVAADLYVDNGEVSWHESVAGAAGKPSEPVKLLPGERLNFDGPATSAPLATKELPRWIKGQPIGMLESRASSAIAQALTSDRPARVGLLELATSRPQKEVKWLALRCLGCVGQFRDVVDALNNPAHKLDWSDYYIDELRAAVARDADTAAAVRLALEKQYPQQASALYRMLWGYSPDGLENGDDATLVKALDDDLLAVRVLAIWNLKDITGLGWSYQPELTAAKRQLATRRWRQRLDAKEIRFKSSDEVAPRALSPPPEGGSR